MSNKITMSSLRARLPTAVALAVVLDLAGGASLAATAPRDQAAVVIVGAGLTGLTTAFELRKAGIDVMLLDAAARPGGRIQTVAFGDGTHAEAHMEEFWQRSPAYRLLRELELPLIEDAAQSSVRIGGRIYPYQSERDAYLRGIFNDPEREALRRWNAKVWGLYVRLHQEHFDEQRALDADLVALEKVSFAEFVRRDGLPEKVSEWIRVTLEPEIAVEWDAISALDGIDEMRVFLDTPEGFGEKNYHVSGGNSRLIEALLDRVGRRRVTLQAEVTAIERGDDGGVRIRYLHQGSRYREVRARAVVVTVPLAAIGRIQFIPPLSAEKRKAIETTRFGAYLKVHVRIASEAAKAWEPGGKTLLTLLSDSPAGSIYDTTAFQPQDLPQRAPPERCLTLLIHGRFARQMLGMNADDMRQQVLRGLDALFPGTAAQVRQAELFVYPTAVAYWPVALGRSRFDDLAAALRRPEGAIWIGGDTTENSHSEGAVQAAQRVARQLIDQKAALQGAPPGRPSPGPPGMARQ